jgi:hypothetical protein
MEYDEEALIGVKAQQISSCESVSNALKMQFRNCAAPAGVIVFSDAQVTVICLWAAEISKKQ